MANYNTWNTTKTTKVTKISPISLSLDTGDKFSVSTNKATYSYTGDVGNSYPSITKNSKKTYPTVFMTGTHGNDVYDSSTERIGNVTDANRNFRQAELADAKKTYTGMSSRSTVQTSHWAETHNNNLMPKADPVEKAKTDLSTFATSLSKNAKYSKLAKNLTTLADETVQKGAEYNAKMQKNSAWSAGLTTGLSTLVSLINPLIGAGVEVVGGIITANFNAKSNDTSYMTEAKKYQQLASSVIGYMESLETRDKYMTTAMNSITSTMDSMRLEYGDAFTDQFYNLMLAKSGMTPDAYSLLTGNFRTYEESGLGYGTASADAGLFDELTMGNADMFNNMYAKLTSEDIQPIMTSLMQALYSGNTEVGEQLRGYEQDIINTMEGFLLSEEASLYDTMSSLANLSSSARSENISLAEQLGSASASRAGSGFRNGTSTANEALVRLSANLSKIATSAQASNLINSLRYAIKQQELNATSTAYNYRSAQKQIGIRSTNTAISSMNSVAMTADEYERNMNEQLENAIEYQEQIEESDEIEIVLNSL